MKESDAKQACCPFMSTVIGGQTPNGEFFTQFEAVFCRGAECPKWEVWTGPGDEKGATGCCGPSTPEAA